MKKPFSGIKKCGVLALCALLAFSMLACMRYRPAEFVQVYETTGTKAKLMTRTDDLVFGKYDADSPNVSVTVNVKEKHQNVYGMGASMTHASAYLLNECGDELRKEILTDLFGRDGANFQFVRVPVGTSDYTKEPFYTLCDLPDPSDTDMALSNFSIEKDAVLIKVLQEIVAINPSVKLIAVPWTAPAWMKTNRSLIRGSLDETFNGVYADYLVKFVQAYAAQGIPFSYISIVNEPYIVNVNYPSMNMDGVQAAAVAKLLGQKLKSAKLKDVSIMAYDHNYSASDAIIVEQYLDEMFADKETNKYVTSVAYHGYGNSGFYDFVGGLDYVNENFKNKELFITEITEHDGSVDFAANLSYGLQNILINPLNYGLSGAMYWNYVLTSQGTPVTGNNSVCYGVISLDKTEDGWVYKKNAAYYAMAHISRYVYETDGHTAVRLTTESSNEGKIIAASMLRGDGAAVVVVHNIDDVTSEEVDIVIDGKSVTYTVLPQSVVTFVC